MKTLQDENSLIKEARKGDQEAFRELVCRYDRQVLNIAASFRNSEEDAKDIYQEVFIRVYKGINNFQFRSEFSTWLFRITTNVCISYNHKQRRRKMESIDKRVDSDDEFAIRFAETIEGEDYADKKVYASEISDKINQAVEELPAQQKMAFTLKYFQEYKIKEIAEMMNCAEGTIKRYLFTATNKLKDRLQNII